MVFNLASRHRQGAPSVFGAIARFVAAGTEDVLWQCVTSRQSLKPYCSVRALVRMRFGVTSSPSTLLRAMLVNTRCFWWSWHDESFVADSSLIASVEPLLRNSHRRVWHSTATDAAR
ncbi:hypothetical protein MTO96_035284 [Rhipicephalus appendiculatus]